MSYTRQGAGEFVNVYNFLRAREVKEEGKKNGFQTEVAKALNISQASVSAAIRVNGRAVRLTANQWLNLASRFNVSVVDLLAIAVNGGVPAQESAQEAV